MENEKIVDFARWCPRCQYRMRLEDRYPCNECLTNPVNTNSHKPVNFVPRFLTEQASGKMKKRER